MDVIRRAIRQVLEDDHPQTNRGIFYRVETLGLIAKTEKEYKRTICRLLAEMRLDGTIPFDWIADNTRWMRKPATHTGVEAALEHHARAYRRALWDTQDAYVEVWLEKDALAGVLMEETQAWDVPLMVTRGYASLSYLYEAAQTIKAVGKPAYLYYFGDYDPSGLDINRNVEQRLREFAPRSVIHFERVAVTAEQIEAWQLPTRPTKLKDSRSLAFAGEESVEVDAIPAQTLRAQVREAIEQHVDDRALEVTQHYEKQEREQSNLLVWLTRRHGFERVVEAASALDAPYRGGDRPLEGYPTDTDGDGEAGDVDRYARLHLTSLSAGEVERGGIVLRVLERLKELDKREREWMAEDGEDATDTGEETEYGERARILSSLWNRVGLDAAHPAAIVLQRKLAESGEWDDPGEEAG